MRRFALMAAILVALTTAFAQGEKDIEGGKDHPLLSRMPGFYLSGYDVKDFDSYDVSAYLSGKDARWEGKLTTCVYAAKTGAKPVSMRQIVQNYENALRKIGAQLLTSGDLIVQARLQKGSALTYVQVRAFNDGRDYDIVVVETKAMEQEVVADAAALSQIIASTGKAAVYGIYFDTGKADIKPESEPALGEITKLLKGNPRMKLFVVGHTDYTGVFEANMKLSADRAQAVVKALIGRGIDASRLKSAGVGPCCPEASNRTEEGRAKNRRVELVEQS